MSNRERQPSRSQSFNEPFVPVVLPPELADFLKDHRFACVIHGSDIGTLYVVKAPLDDIRHLVGPIPISIEHQLHQHPAAPVLRTVFTFFDDTDRPLALETFVNVADPQQRADFASLTTQRELHLLFYDEQLVHRLSKGVRNGQQRAMAALLERAQRLATAVPPDTFDFERAKDAVIASNPL